MKHLDPTVVQLDTERQLTCDGGNAYYRACMLETVGTVL